MLSAAWSGSTWKGRTDIWQWILTSMMAAEFLMSALTSSSSSPPSPSLLFFLSAPGFSSPACRQQLSVQSRTEQMSVRLQPFCARLQNFKIDAMGFEPDAPLIGPVFLWSGWSPGGAFRQSGRPDGDRCRGDQDRRNTPRTLEASAVGSWRLAWSFCILPERKPLF